MAFSIGGFLGNAIPAAQKSYDTMQQLQAGSEAQKQLQQYIKFIQGQGQPQSLPSPAPATTPSLGGVSPSTGGIAPAGAAFGGVGPNTLQSGAAPPSGGATSPSNTMNSNAPPSNVSPEMWAFIQAQASTSNPYAQKQFSSMINPQIADAIRLQIAQGRNAVQERGQDLHFQSAEDAISAKTSIAQATNALRKYAVDKNLNNDPDYKQVATDLSTARNIYSRMGTPEAYQDFVAASANYNSYMNQRGGRTGGFGTVTSPYAPPAVKDTAADRKQIEAVDDASADLKELASLVQKYPSSVGVAGAARRTYGAVKGLTGLDNSEEEIAASRIAELSSELQSKLPTVLRYSSYGGGKGGDSYVDVTKMLQSPQLLQANLSQLQEGLNRRKQELNTVVGGGRNVGASPDSGGWSIEPVK